MTARKGPPPLIGRHYRRLDHAYCEARKVLEIEDGKVGFISTAGMKYGRVKVATFQDTFPYLVPPGEPVKRYAFALSVGGVDVWHVYKADRRFPMAFLYSLDGQAIYAETPEAADDDIDQQFDVRDLPDCYLAGLRIMEPCKPGGVGGVSPVEAEMREKAAHIVAIGRALGDGFDILAHQRTVWAEKAAQQAEYRRLHPPKSLPIPKPLRRAMPIDEDDLPF